MFSGLGVFSGLEAFSRLGMFSGLGVFSGLAAFNRLVLEHSRGQIPYSRGTNTNRHSVFMWRNEKYIHVLKSREEYNVNSQFARSVYCQTVFAFHCHRLFGWTDI